MSVTNFIKTVDVGRVLWELDALVGEDNDGDVDESHLYFGWKRKVKKYKLVDY